MRGLEDQRVASTSRFGLAHVALGCLLVVAALGTLAPAVATPPVEPPRAPAPPEPGREAAERRDPSEREVERAAELDAAINVLAERFEVVELRRGYLLQARALDDTPQTIEIGPEGLFADRQPIRRSELDGSLADAEIEALGRLVHSRRPPPVGPPLGDDVLRRRAQQLEEAAERLRELERQHRVEERRERERVRELERERVREIERRTEQLREEALELQRRERRERRVRTSHDDRVSIGGSVRVAHDEEVAEAVSIGGPLEIRGRVDGDATAVLGSVAVYGEVDGSLTAIAGDVELHDGAEIDGDVVVIGGELRRYGDTSIDGEVRRVGLGSALIQSGPSPSATSEALVSGDGWLELFGDIVVALLLLGLVWATCWFGGERVERVARRASVEAWKCGLVGLVALVLGPPLFLVLLLVLVLSVIGIPIAAILALLVVPAALALALVALTASSLESGRWLARRFDRSTSSPYVLAAAGFALIWGWSLLGDAIDLFGWVFTIAAVLALIVGALIKLAALAVGLGAILLTFIEPLPPDWSPDDDEPPLPPLPSDDPLPPPVPPSRLPTTPRDGSSPEAAPTVTGLAGGAAVAAASAPAAGAPVDPSDEDARTSHPERAADHDATPGEIDAEDRDSEDVEAQDVELRDVEAGDLGVDELEAVTPADVSEEEPDMEGVEAADADAPDFAPSDLDDASSSLDPPPRSS
ncbi:MAG: polymer-forming cytoskeletal protein [Acidobacteriota bacterium]